MDEPPQPRGVGEQLRRLAPRQLAHCAGQLLDLQPRRQPHPRQQQLGGVPQRRRVGTTKADVRAAELPRCSRPRGHLL
ncbi:hypothetical protein [Nannocystis pusilla]|uniref:hypothetical protein n=1 Tax=Nannocystis pusilla TaxID=889268 RepID=UPI003B816B8D